MSVALRVTLRSAAVPGAHILRTVGELKRLAGYGDYAVGVWVAGDATVARLNREYRGKRGVTDILSFSPHALAAPEAFGPAAAGGGGGGGGGEEGGLPRDLGDMVIAGRFVRDTCARDGLDLEAHYDTLLCHGLVHLLGYDHENDDDHARMAAREAGLLEALRRGRLSAGGEGGGGGGLASEPAPG